MLCVIQTMLCKQACGLDRRACTVCYSSAFGQACFGWWFHAQLVICCCAGLC